jgi:hypothetical protein
MDNARVVKFLAIVLAVVGGCVGVHRFFLNTSYRWLMLILGLSGFFLGIPLIITYVWAIIDIIRMGASDDVEVLFPPEEKGEE